MKILIATGIFPPDIGGPATYAAQFAAECPRYGHTATVVAYGGNKGHFRHAVFFLACLRAGYSADIIFAQGTVSAGAPAALAACILRKRLIVRVAGDFAWEYAMNQNRTSCSIEDFQKQAPSSPVIFLARRIQRLVCRASAHIIAPSLYLKDIVTLWGVPARKITVVRNAVTAHGSFSAVRNPSPSVIFSAGRMVSWKGFAGLIRVFSRLSNEFPDARLVIAGDGPCRDDLLREARARGVSGRVSFLGTVPREEMPALYRAASCFVLFSDYEGLPHTVLEALSYTLPVIASDVGGTGELVHGGVNGMLVPRGDERALEGAIRAFFKNPKKEVPFSGYIAGQDCTHDTMMKQTIAVMEENV